MIPNDDLIWHAIERVSDGTRPLVLTVAQVATILNVSGLTVRRMIAKGDLAAQRFLGAVRIPAAEVFRVLGAEPSGEAG